MRLVGKQSWLANLRKRFSEIGLGGDSVVRCEARNKFRVTEMGPDSSGVVVTANVPFELIVRVSEENKDGAVIVVHGQSWKPADNRQFSSLTLDRQVLEVFAGSAVDPEKVVDITAKAVYGPYADVNYLMARVKRSAEAVRALLKWLSGKLNIHAIRQVNVRRSGIGLVISPGSDLGKINPDHSQNPVCPATEMAEVSLQPERTPAPVDMAVDAVRNIYGERLAELRISDLK